MPTAAPAPRGLGMATPSSLFENATCLIPAAGRLPEGIASVASVSSSAMLPVGGKPVIHWTMEYLLQLGFVEFRVGVSRRGTAIEDYVDFVFGGRARVDWVECSPTESVGHSVLRLCSSLTGHALVVLGDTIFRFGDAPLPASSPWILTSEVEDSSHWCVVSTDSDGRVMEWFDKRSDVEVQTAAVGVYWIPDSATVNSMELESDRSIEMSELMRHVAGASGVYALPAGDWRDCGHPETYEVSKKGVLAERSFNTLIFDDLMGTVRKSSTRTEKLIDEINYLTSLPRDLAALFPRVIDSSTEEGDPWMEMEYYGYPTLAELYLYHQLHPVMWDRVMLRLGQLLQRFREHRSEVLVEDQQAMYVDKTYSRLEGAKQLPGIGDLIARGQIVVNGVVLEDMTSLRPRILEAVHRNTDAAVGAMIHGDLCFSNILYDIRTGVCKLLDPRGSFGSPGLFGDQRYDVAKLHHSVVGKYDHLVAGLFSMDLSDPHALVLTIPQTSLHADVEAFYRKHVLSGYDELEIELITGLVMVGLPPLHTESVDRQIALYLRGLAMVNRALGTGVSS